MSKESSSPPTSAGAGSPPSPSPAPTTACAGTPSAPSPAPQDETFIAEKLAEKSLDYFHESMNNEISRLWQRSIFLAGFLGLLFAGYGNVLLKLFGREGAGKIEFCYASPLNLVCVGISTLGILFSVLWIMMGKGSKAWQEKHERTIFNFERHEIENNEVFKKLSARGLAHGYLNDVSSEKFDNCIFSEKSGAYSPSKINIAIGQISLALWSLCALFHFFSYCSSNNFCEILNSSRTWGIVIPTVVFICMCVNIIFRCKSDVIQNAQNRARAREKVQSVKERKQKPTDDKSNSHENK